MQCYSQMLEAEMVLAQYERGTSHLIKWLTKLNYPGELTSAINILEEVVGKSLLKYREVKHWPCPEDRVPFEFPGEADLLAHRSDISLRRDKARVARAEVLVALDTAGLNICRWLRDGGKVSFLLDANQPESFEALAYMVDMVHTTFHSLRMAAQNQVLPSHFPDHLHRHWDRLRSFLTDRSERLAGMLDKYQLLEKNRSDEQGGAFNPGRLPDVRADWLEVLSCLKQLEGYLELQHACLQQEQPVRPSLIAMIKSSRPMQTQLHTEPGRSSTHQPRASAADALLEASCRDMSSLAKDSRLLDRICSAVAVGGAATLKLGDCSYRVEALPDGRKLRAVRQGGDNGRMPLLLRVKEFFQHRLADGSVSSRAERIGKLLQSQPPRAEVLEVGQTLQGISALAKAYECAIKVQPHAEGERSGQSFTSRLAKLQERYAVLICDANATNTADQFLVETHLLKNELAEALEDRLRHTYCALPIANALYYSALEGGQIERSILHGALYTIYSERRKFLLEQRSLVGHPRTYTALFLAAQQSALDKLETELAKLDRPTAAQFDVRNGRLDSQQWAREIQPLFRALEGFMPLVDEAEHARYIADVARVLEGEAEHQQNERNKHPAGSKPGESAKIREGGLDSALLSLEMLNPHHPDFEAEVEGIRQRLIREYKGAVGSSISLLGDNGWTPDGLATYAQYREAGKAVPGD
ncbi:hypothetical protein FNU76_01825 [Chitinimonas arctica]|uniref:Uncharacterized protein n=2 Tax=Chitinimonas arctica TaxID=2594795 RepID=A0A516SAM1_9NEIS|nr:hypothetical protein FNU76_01825 [Chitinimonas arctica]